MITAVRRIQFCAGHRVNRHESKCAHPHGHNYVAFFHATAPDLDDKGRVIDFAVLKEIIGRWIDTNWDHGFIYASDDAESDAMFKSGKFKVFVMPYNPTAENMARFLLKNICPLLMKPYGVVIERVVIWETENCYAEAHL